MKGKNNSTHGQLRYSGPVNVPWLVQPALEAAELTTELTGMKAIPVHQWALVQDR